MEQCTFLFTILCEKKTASGRNNTDSGCHSFGNTYCYIDLISIILIIKNGFEDFFFNSIQAATVEDMLLTNLVKALKYP